jgi:hypothetical protein
LPMVPLWLLGSGRHLSIEVRIIPLIVTGVIAEDRTRRAKQPLERPLPKLRRDTHLRQIRVVIVDCLDLGFGIYLVEFAKLNEPFRPPPLDDLRRDRRPRVQGEGLLPSLL